MKFCGSKPSKLNSLIDQLSQWATSDSVQCCGSVALKIVNLIQFGHNAIAFHLPFGMLYSSRSLSQLSKLAAITCDILCLVPGVNGGTWFGISGKKAEKKQLIFSIDFFGLIFKINPKKNFFLHHF